MILKSYGGHDLAPDFEAWIADGSGRALPGVQVQLAQRLKAWPVITGIGRPGHKLTIWVQLLTTDLDAGRLELMQWFDPESETPAALVATDDDGVSHERYRMCLCDALQPMADGGGYSAKLYVATLTVDGDVRWRSVAEPPVTWAVTSDGDTEVVTNGGEDEACPRLTIEPTAAKTSGDPIKRFVPIVWKALAGATSYPFKIGPLDTASLIKTATATTLNGAFNAGATACDVTNAAAFPTAGMAYITDGVAGNEQISWTGKAGNQLTGCTRGIGGTADVTHSGGQAIAVSKMLANGDDLRILVDGFEDENRWLVDINNANTYIWVNLNFAAKQATTLAANYGAGDVITTLSVASTAGFPSAGMLLIGTEVFTYTGVSGGNSFTGVTRAAKGTTAGAHIIGDAVYWIQSEVYLKYNDQDAAAPATDDNYQPILKETSTNGSWIYEEFGEDDKLRTGAWLKDLDGLCTFHTADHMGDADPWQEMGMTIHDGYGYGQWRVHNPCYISNANFSNGEKRTTDKTKWGTLMCIYSTIDGDFWYGQTEYSIPAPAADNNWEAWSRNEAITAGRAWVAFKVYLAVNPGVTHDLEVADVTLTLDGTYTPTHTIGTEQTDTYTLDCTITNNTTGEAISLVYLMAINEELEADCALETVTDLTDSSNQRQALTVEDAPRRRWLRLLPGSNTLQYDEGGVVAVTVTVEWAERYYS